MKLLALVVSDILIATNFVTAAVAAADIDDSIQRKRICVSLKNGSTDFGHSNTAGKALGWTRFKLSTKLGERSQGRL